MENVIKEENKKKSLIIVTLVLLAIIGLVIGVYFLFFNKKKEELLYPNDDSRFRYSTFDGQKFTKYERINLTENNTEVIINNKKVNIKIFNNYIYINDKNTNIISDTKNNLLSSDYKLPYVDITDYFIITYSNSGDYDSYNKIIDENGKELNLLNGGSLGDTYFYLKDNLLYAVEMIFDDDGKDYRPYYLHQVKYDDGKIYFISAAQPVEQIFYMLHDVLLGENNKQIRMMASIKPFNMRVEEGKLFINDTVKIDDDEFWIESAYITRDLVYFLSSNQCSYSIKYALDKNGEIITISDSIIGIDDFSYEHNRLYANLTSTELINEIECVNNGKAEFIYNGKNIEIKNIKK